MKKKFIVFTIILTIFFSSSIIHYSLASDEVLLTREKAVQTIEQKLNLNVPNDIRLELRPDYKYQGKKIWDINWSESTAGGERYYFITIDDNADIRSYYCLDPTLENQDLTNSVTRKEAREKALEFLKRVDPLKINYIREKPQFSTSHDGIRDFSYKFEFERLIDGIPFPDNTISIETYVDGSIMSYVVDWDYDMNFPKAQKIISKKDAENLFKENMSMVLNYSYDITKENEKNFFKKDLPLKLVYSPFFRKSTIIDANNGKFIDDDGKYVLEDKKLQQMAKKKNVKQVEYQPITKDEALSKVKELVKYDLLDEGERSYSENYLDSTQNYIKFDFTRTQKGEGIFRSWIYANAIVNLGTGELIYLKANYIDNLSLLTHTQEQIPSNVQPVSWQEGLQIVSDFAKKIAPEQFENTYLVNDESQNISEIGQSRQLVYQFGRIVNGIPFDENGFYIIIDTVTRDIIGFEYSWDDKEFPEVKKIVSEDKAKRTFCKYFDVELSYLRSAEDPNQAILVYMIKTPNVVIDAKTGEIFSPYAYAPIEDMLYRIKGSKAEKELSILINQGVIPETRNFDPEKPVKRGEVLKLIYDAKIKNLPEDLSKYKKPSFKDVWKDSPYFYYIETAVRDGLIMKKNKFYPEKNITREDLAVIFINLIDYGEVAKFNDIYKVKVNDASQISENKRGAVALAMAFEIIEPIDGNFYPNDYATWEDVACAILKAANKIKR